MKKNGGNQLTTSESLGFKFFLITEMWHVYFQLEFYTTGKQDSLFLLLCHPNICNPRKQKAFIQYFNMYFNSILNG